MIETINSCIIWLIFVMILIGHFAKIEWIKLIAALVYFPVLFYFFGFELASNNKYSAIWTLAIILFCTGAAYWKWKRIELEEEERTYSREELITAKKIFDSNYLANPEDFEDTKGTYEDAQVTIDYLLGIIDADSKKYRKVKYGTRKAES
mgnify:CR=1 FL=1